MLKGIFDNVSRETRQNFMLFKELLLKWNQKVNLVSSNSVSEFMTRHVLDSIQLVKYIHKKNGVWLDIGSGGGFPGIPLAIYSKEKYPKFEFSFMDSNLKKCFFLEEVCQNLNIEANVICDRIETAPVANCDYIVSRALGPLGNLLKYSKRHRKKEGKSLFLKGKNINKEISIAKGRWKFSYKVHQSLSHETGKIIEINQHDILKRDMG